MNKNRKLTQKVISSAAVGLAAVLGTVQICTVPVSAKENGESTEVCKEETVYVNADASGNPTGITVSDWLRNAGTETIVNDESILDGIKNVKGDETFTGEGDSITWNTMGKDIYYQGTTEKELPVSVSLTWYLNGTEISPEELNGKSGQLKIQIDYENNAEKTVTVDGKQENVYTPFVMMTGLILPDETCSDVVIDNGRVISDGDRNIVVGFAMPGMTESLGLNEEENSSLGLVLPESFTITAEVTDFEVPATYTVALTDLLEELDLDSITDMDDIRNALDELEDAAVSLSGGASDLADGADTLEQGVDSYTEGVDELRTAVSTYLGTDGELSGKVTEYQDGVNKVVLGVRDYVDGAETLADGVTAYIQGEEQLAGGAEELSALGDGLEEMQSALDRLAVLTDGETDNDGGKDLKAAAQSLADATQKLENALGSDAVKTLTGQLETMTKTGQELLEQAGMLDEEAGEAVAGPVENIAEQLESLSGELQKITQLQTNLETACSRINEVILADNARISEAKEKGAAARLAVSESVAALEEQKAALGEKDPEAAGKLQSAIDALKCAEESAAALETLEEPELTDAGSLEYDAIDMEAVRQAAEEIRANMESFSGVSGTLEEQIAELQVKISELEQMTGAFPESDMEELSGEIRQLNQGMQQLNAAIGGSGGLSESIGLLDRSAAASFPAAVEGLDALNAGFEGLRAYNEQLSAGAASLKEAGETLVGGSSTLGKGTETLLSGLQSLSSRIDQGTALLSENSQTLRDGAGTLRDGVRTLSESMDTFEKDGTGKLQSTVEEKAGDIADRLKALNSEEAGYDSFSGKESSMEGNVKFIIETEAGGN